ncbi:hypothetical protein ABZ949_33525 [Micromonospora tulbaghiae]|uniref:hypothetical protein n=1 Tax=Micromonospora tulbaghiae TaxID=479978 RepID=UPI0033E22010
MTSPDQPTGPYLKSPHAGSNSHRPRASDQPPGLTDRPPGAPARTSRCWQRILVTAVVGLIGAGAVACALVHRDKNEAIRHCQAAISKKLRAPSTAEFTDTTVSRGDSGFGTHYYDVAGTVDAQNGFGAMVRGEYTCELTQRPDGQWLVTSTRVL